MIRTIKCLLAIFLLSFSLSSFAAKDLSSLQVTKHGSKPPQAASANKLRSSSYYQTIISVINNSNDEVTMKVPGTSIFQTLYPGDYFDILSPDYFDEVLIVLYDADGYEFFRGYVANHSEIEIRNYLLTRGAGAESGKKAKGKLQAIIKKTN